MVEPNNPIKAPAKAPVDLLIIDGHALAFRSYFSVPATLTTPDGHPVNVIFGFIHHVLRAVSEFSPRRVGICFDHPSPTFRHHHYPAYKAQRPPAPADFVSQIPRLQSALNRMGFPIISVPGVEADDVMGTLATTASMANESVVIFTSDRDCLQLVNNTVVLATSKKTTKSFFIYTPTEIMEEYELTPAQIVDFKALKGDPSDNIPGVPGIGDKTAVRLLKSWGTLQNIYTNIGEITPKSLQEKLVANHQLATMSYTLATIKCDVEIPPVDLTFHPNWAETKTLFLEHKFTTLLHHYRDKFGDIPNAPETVAPAPPEIPQITRLEPEDITHLTAGFAFCLSADKTRIDFAYSPEKAFGIVVTPAVIPDLAPLFTNSKIPKITADSKQAAIDLSRWNIGLSGVTLDQTIAHFLLDPTGQRPPIEDPRILIADANRLTAELTAANLTPLFTTIELPVAQVLAQMEIVGIGIDRPYLEKLKVDFDCIQRKIQDEIFALVPPFNPNSPKQLAEILFNKLGLPIIKKGKSGPSTNSHVLERLASLHPLPKKILAHRQIEKLQNTYVTVLPTMINPTTGRIHTSFNQTVAQTGRLSSTNPNLQNIPVRSHAGSQIRQAFVAKPGYTMISADYSQIELRILAHLANDPTMIGAFQAGEDIHRATAAIISGKPVSDVSDAERYRAKSVNFGIIYGISGFGLSEQLMIPQAQAKIIIDDYFEKFPKIQEFINSTITQATHDGYVRTEFGRIRRLPDLTSSNAMKRQMANRIAVNTRIQGTAADIIKLAMIHIQAEFTAKIPTASILLQVHDELVIECPTAELPAVTTIIKSEMESVVSYQVPLTIDLATGPNWEVIS